MEKMFRTFLAVLIALSLLGAGANQTFAQMAKHSVSGDIVQITICAADQSPKTILIDQNGNQVPEPVQCDCPACTNCLTGPAFKLPSAIGAVVQGCTVILTILPQSFDITGAAFVTPATARAPPHKV
ncbi:hypothetical protein [Thalassospira sp.]|uniref:hypothetical protein n=1 Tax=Thalassospira sp. TaxID=1912094 RepID=UPI003AA9162D